MYFLNGLNETYETSFEKIMVKKFRQNEIVIILIPLFLCLLSCKKNIKKSQQNQIYYSEKKILLSNLNKIIRHNFRRSKDSKNIYCLKKNEFIFRTKKMDRGH